MPKLKPRLKETPTGLLTYDLGADYVLVFPLATKLEEKFGLEAGQMPIFGLEQVFVDLVKGDLKISVGWDIWSDLFVMAMDKKANPLVKEISEYLDSILDELEELEEQLIAEQEEKKKNELS